MAVITRCLSVARGAVCPVVIRAEGTAAITRCILKKTDSELLRDLTYLDLRKPSGGHIVGFTEQRQPVRPHQTELHYFSYIVSALLSPPSMLMRPLGSC